jgi:hypothetical protein
VPVSVSSNDCCCVFVPLVTPDIPALQKDGELHQLRTDDLLSPAFNVEYKRRRLLHGSWKVPVVKIYGTRDPRLRVTLLLG